uniref:DNA-directed RNA polymerase subunit n=2 Tax=Hirondellea gigas TaxID=1518452 RepID=A0A6A7FQ94_9CRUS
MKELYREKEMVNSIAAIKFNFLSSNQIQQMAHMKVECSKMYLQDQPREPHPLGTLSKIMGVNQKDSVCSTCGQKLQECPGHFGYIDLELPLYHYGNFKCIVQIMQNICKTCSRVLLKDDQISKFAEMARKYKDDYLNKKKTVKKLNELCKKVKLCPHCGEKNGVIKKSGPLKITHELFRGAKKDDQMRKDYLRQFETVFEYYVDMKEQMPGNPIEIYYPDQVLRLFDSISTLDVAVMCMDPYNSHPRDLILTRIPVPPSCVRPSVVADLKKLGSNEDDITTLLSLIVYINQVIKKRIHARLDKLMEAWEVVQMHSALLINSDFPLPSNLNLNRKPYTGYIQRLKGKQGRFRGNLSGKRVDFSSRTVISPDPTLKLHQVGVPVEVAMILTYNDRVTPHNIEKLRLLVDNGNNKYPGAYSFQQTSTGRVFSLKFKAPNSTFQISQNLKEGDIVTRHLVDGDTVLFNRQPSLHKMSIMAHQVKVLPWRTFRFNECVCNPYNADFDGDEMNLHVPQTEEARAEASALMGVVNNLVTPRSGALIIAATQDFLTGSFLLTSKDMFFDKAGACQLMGVLTEDGGRIELPIPAILKPHELWTGKQLFSLVLKPNRDAPINCNLLANKCKDPLCSFKGEMCSSDNFVHVRNSELLCGVLDKSMLGAGSKKNVFFSILKDYGKLEAAEMMWRVARLSIQYLMMSGFSIGLGDLCPPDSLILKKEKLLEEGYSECQKFIQQLANKELDLAPGCTAEESLEQVILNELSKIRESAGHVCISELRKLDPYSPGLVMAVSGSKGSVINLSQMVACVGQQAISGKRVPDGCITRSLPHFRPYSKVPEAKGFVSNSFYSGLAPSEFLFHTMGGREGLVDTAVKTAETGYMQRRLVKGLEDLYLAYDGTVRNSTQSVIQFKYGDDGLDPAQVETDSNRNKDEIAPPLDFDRILYHVKALDANKKQSLNWAQEDTKIKEIENQLLTSDEVIKYTKAYLEDLNKNERFGALSDTFKKSIEDFMLKESKLMAISEMAEEKLQCIQKLRPLNLENLIAFVDTLVRRYMGSNALASGERMEAGAGIVVEPGTALGAVCAQSIGEPATQMTLKTFHFAGVAAMNITLGVPRIKEIINATRLINTPIITAQLLENRDPLKARQVKARIEKTLLGEVCDGIHMLKSGSEMCYIVQLSSESINLLQLKVSAESIKYSICTSKMKIRENEVEVASKTLLIVRPNYDSKVDPYYQMQHIIKHLPKIVIKGLPTVSRAVVHQRPLRPEDKDRSPVYELLVEGNNLREVIATYGVDGNKCRSNNILEMANTLGIEAARQTIINEITMTMSQHGLSVDCRHVNLLADVMTSQGAVHGITRHGLANTKSSVLMLASFEKTADHLFEAAYHGQVDKINGVSDCIIMGKPINIGTGLFRLVQQHRRSDARPKEHKIKSDLLPSIEEVLRDSRRVDYASVVTKRRTKLFDVPAMHVALYQSGAR